MPKNTSIATPTEENDDFASHPVFGTTKSFRLQKRQRRYRKIGMHRLKSTHLLSVKLIEEV